MSELVVTWVISALTYVLFGLAALGLLVRRLSMSGRQKACLFAVLFAILFTPMLVPAGTIAAIVVPMLGVGLLVFWWHPINIASLAACAIVGFVAGWWLFAAPSNTQNRRQHS